MSRRVKFFLTHLTISILISLFILAWVFWVWYPESLAKAVGVTHIFLMLLVVDMIIGPLLGLIVYKEGKNTLKFDLSVIFLIQISALIYGVYAIAQGRPVWIVYNVDRFDLVRNNEVIRDGLQKKNGEYKNNSLFKLDYVAIEQTQNEKQRTEDMFTEALGGVSLSQMPERYAPLENAKSKMQQRAQSLDNLKNFNSTNEVNKIIQKYPQSDAWLPLKATVVDMVVLINKEKGEVVKIVDLRPWK